MIGLTSPEVYISIFSITEEINKFELYTGTFDKFLFEEIKDEIEEIICISDFTPSQLQHGIKRPRIIQTNKKLRSGKSSADGYTLSLMGYARSLFRDLESYLRIVVGLGEEDIQLTLKQYISNFVTYEITPCIYSIKDSSEAVYNMGDHEGTLKIEHDDISMKRKLILTLFGGIFRTLRVDQKSFFNTLLGFQTSWDYKPTNASHADNPGVYTSDKFLNLGTSIKKFI